MTHLCGLLSSIVVPVLVFLYPWLPTVQVLNLHCALGVELRELRFKVAFNLGADVVGLLGWYQSRGTVSFPSVFQGSVKY
jgi:hypothetical protein